MSPDILLLLVIIGIALVLFSIERLPADVIALGVLLSLVLTGLLPADLAFAGFGSEAVLLILGLFILTASLARTGVVDITARTIVRKIGDDPKKMSAVVLGGPALLSTFMSNTAATAFFLPIVIGLAHKMKANPSKYLMPLAFASILASSVTLLATSTNILVSGLITQFGMAPIGLFELTPVGIPILIVGLLYMYFLGYRLIPQRNNPSDNLDGGDAFPYLTDTVILPKSPLIGKTLFESGLGRDLDITVLKLVRGKQRYLAPTANIRLEAGDELLVEGHRDEILKIKSTAGIDIKADVKLSDPSLESVDSRLVEAIILPRSPLIGRTLKGLGFRDRYGGLQVLAINRHGETLLRKISQIPLRMGDVLLLQGHYGNISTLQNDKFIRVLGAVDDRLPNLKRAPIAAAIFTGVLLLGALNVMSFPVAMLLGSVAVFITRCITPEEAYREVEWRALILIGSMLGLGTALQVTGTADFLAEQIVARVGFANPYFLLTAFFVLTLLLTQPMSNQAAAVVVLPVALQTALQLGINPRTFVIMIAVAASTSFLTPLEPSCLLVYGPGRYRFMDFLKVGSLLTLLIYFVAILLVPVIWPF